MARYIIMVDEDDVSKMAAVLADAQIDATIKRVHCLHYWSQDDVEALSNAANVSMTDQEMEDVLTSAEKALEVDCSDAWVTLAEALKDNLNERGIDFDEEGLDDFEY